jgi:hypothetical protein
MIMAGGVLAVLYGTESKSAILVLHIGLSAPLIGKTLAQTSTNTTIDTTPRSRAPGRHMDAGGSNPKIHPSLLQFLAGR